MVTSTSASTCRGSKQRPTGSPSHVSYRSSLRSREKRTWRGRSTARAATRSGRAGERCRHLRRRRRQRSSPITKTMPSQASSRTRFDLLDRTRHHHSTAPTIGLPSAPSRRLDRTPAAVRTALPPFRRRRTPRARSTLNAGGRYPSTNLHYHLDLLLLPCHPTKRPRTAAVVSKSTI